MKKNHHNLIFILLILAIIIFSFAMDNLTGIQVVRAEENPILSAIPNWIFPVKEYFSLFQAGTDFGFSVSGAGNVVVDGPADVYDEVIIGAPTYKVNSNPFGAIFLFQGSVSGLARTPSLILYGKQQGSAFGCSVSNLGDVNDDGYEDFAVGACRYTNEIDGTKLTESGAAFVFHGSNNAAYIDENWIYAADKEKSLLGSAISGGDVNGDGFADLLVGAPGYSEGFSKNGKIFLFFGSSDGLSAESDWTAIGESKSAVFGSSVAIIGDVNGDQLPDILVGAPQPGTIFEPLIGNAYVFYSNSLTGFNSEPDWSVTNEQPFAKFGLSVAGVNVNGDDYYDVIIGSPGALENEIAVGCVYLYLGSEKGLDSTYAWKKCGDQQGGGFGTSISSAGDMNGDGFEDFLVGMPEYSDSNEGMGAVYLYFGNSDPKNEENFEFEVVFGNKAYTDFGVSVKSAGYVNGDNQLDVIVGAPDFKINEIRYGGSMVYYAGIAGVPEPGEYSIFLPMIQTGN